MATLIPIGQLSVSSTELPGLIDQVESSPIPAPPKSLKDNASWILVVFRNETPFQVNFTENTYWAKVNGQSAGTYAASPQNISAFSVGSFSSANKNDPNLKTAGTQGGNAWTIVLDDKTPVDLALGWAVPYVGSIKFGLTFSSDPKSAFEAAALTQTKVETTSTYATKTSDNVPLAFHVHVEDNTPAKTTIVTLKMDQVAI